MNLLATGLLSLLALTGGLPEVSWLGEDNPAGSARALGMGETGFLEPSALGALENPSILGMADIGLRIDLSGSAVFSMEKRSRKVYDSFGSCIGESEYSFNQDISFLPGGAAALVKGVWNLPAAFSFAAGWRVPRLFHYSWNRTVRDDNYVKTGEEILEISGNTNELAVSAAFAPLPMFCFGFGGGYLIGSRTTDWERTYVDPTITDEYMKEKEDISGIAVRGGILFLPVERVTVSLMAEKPVNYTISDSTAEFDVDLPLSIHAGAVYLPGNRLRSTFAADIYWEDSGSTLIDGEDAGHRNSWGFHAGVENHLPGGLAARIGFAYDRSPLARTLDRMTFTAGLGVRISDWDVDFGASFSPVRWRQTEFPGLISFSSGDSLSIEESLTRVMISIGRAL